MDNPNFEQEPSLSALYGRHFLIGAAVNARTADSQSELLKRHYNSLTAENEMKFASLHPGEEQYDFAAADKIASFARENGMKLRGHTLVWHNQTPDWLFQNRSGGLTDRGTLFTRLKAHIDAVVGRYKDSVYCWDVVNEAVADAGPELLRESRWTAVAGDRFIAKAFELAHEADPEALLFYNDYNECHPEKREKIFSLVKSLVERGVPIHGIGLQAHWNLNLPSLDDVRRAIERYASLGLQLQITEMDVSVFDHDDRRTDLKEPAEGMMERQAERYERFFRVFLEYRDSIASVTFWGAADDYTWLDDFPVRGRKNWPLLFDRDRRPKPAFWKAAEVAGFPGKDGSRQG